MSRSTPHYLFLPKLPRNTCGHHPAQPPSSRIGCVSCFWAPYVVRTHLVPRTPKG